jgi:hypothetical protein
MADPLSATHPQNRSPDRGLTLQAGEISATTRRQSLVFEQTAIRLPLLIGFRRIGQPAIDHHYKSW